MKNPDRPFYPARDLVQQLLRAEVTQDSDPMLFDEDVVLFAVRYVEKHDPVWLLDRLKDSTLPIEGRVEVVRNLSGLTRQGLKCLRDEDPEIAPELGET